MIRVVLALVVIAGAGGIAHAQQVEQTWVSGVGDDTNPCTRTAPCFTFAGALAQTIPGGEIDVLDPGDFGSITITTSLTIDGIVGGGLQAVSTDGITIDAAATDVVTLRNLTIYSVATGSGNGIRFVGGGALAIDKVSITGFNTGLAFQPAGDGQLVATSLTSSDNAGSGLVVGSTGGIATAAISESHFGHNAIGVMTIAGGHLGVYDSALAGNAIAGASAELGSTGDAQINLQSVNVSQNGIGARALGTAVIRMSQVQMTGNTMSTVESDGGRLLSFGDNDLDVVPSIMLAAASSSQTVTAGETATFAATVTYLGIHAQPITFACTGLPEGVACSVTPSGLTDGVNVGDVTVTVTTVAPITTTVGVVVSMIGIGLILVLRAGRRRILRAGLVVMALATACGDDAPSPTTTTTPGTPMGSYDFTITASAGTVEASTPLTLVVQ